MKVIVMRGNAVLEKIDSVERIEKAKGFVRLVNSVNVFQGGMGGMVGHRTFSLDEYQLIVKGDEE